MLMDFSVTESVLMPHELNMLQGIFDGSVKRFGYCKNGIEARILATTMIDLYRRGLRDEEKLKVLFAS